MKICPKCKGFVLYEDSQSSCPLCNCILMNYKREVDTITQNIFNSSINLEDKHNKNESVSNLHTDFLNNERKFESVNGRAHILQGRITEITAITRYQTRSHKFINSLFRAEPYQLGHSTHSVRIRVEESKIGRYSENVRDVIAMGDFEGKLFIGSDVTINAIERSERLIASSIFLHDTDRRIYPGFQIPSLLIRSLSILLMFIIVQFVVSIFNGSLFSFIGILLMSLINGIISIIAPLLPYFILIGGGLYYFKKWRS